ncbi:MAG: DMT family transporter [Caldilineaceae bacterium]|nr:DMT family transporter [Caldilineaceae bacterium]
MAFSLQLDTQRQRLAQWSATSSFGWVLALSSNFASSIVTPLSRGLIVAGVDPISLLLARLSIAVGLIIVTLAGTQPGRFKIDRRGFWRVLAVGLIAGVEICCFFSALAYVDASMSAIIKSTQPLVVLLMLALGGERLTSRHWVRLGLATMGIYLLVGGPGGGVAPMGLILLLFSLLLYAAQLVFTQWWLAGYNAHTVTLYLSSLMTIVITFWWWVQGAIWSDPGTQGWIIILVMAVVSTWFARLALYGAIPRIGSGQIALLWPLQTLIIIILSVLFLNERMTLVQWIGGGFVLSSAVLAMERFRWPLNKPAPG